jgi:very-short-patch-repair endonuclease
LRLANQFRRQALRREREAANALVRFYGETWRRLSSDIQDLRNTIEQMTEAGEEITKGTVTRLERLKAIRNQAAKEANKFSKFADAQITAGQREAIKAAERNGHDLIRAFFPDDVDLDELGVTFFRMPSESVENLAGMLQNGAPLRELLDEAVGEASEAFGERMVTGLASGWNPRKLARELRKEYGMGLTRALRISRTEQLRAYRETQRQVYDESDVVTGWERHAVGDSQTCMACFVDWKVPILTSEGSKPISKVGVGDLVLTHRGRYRKVTKLYRQSVGSAPIVTIRADLPGGVNWDSLTMTEEHPVLTNRGWMRADELTTNDRLVVMTQPCEVCGKQIPHWHYGTKTCSRTCVGKLAAEGLHSNEEAHNRAVENMKATHHKMMERGEHPFQDSEIRRRAQRNALRANSRLTSSRTEGKLAEAFDALGLEYETQYPIQSHYNESNNRQYWYYADFAFPEAGIVVEADGEPWHSWDDDRIEHDKLRDERLEAQGWDVLHYSGSEICKDAEGIAQQVKRLVMNHTGQHGTTLVAIKNIQRGVRHPPSEDFKVVRYNLEVEEDHSYVAKYAVVHNCIAKDGEFYDTKSAMDDHPNGRCYMLPVTKSYEELGIDAPEPEFQRETAREWFRRQDEATQREMMGDAKYEAWKEGRFALEDIAKVNRSDVWGDSWVPKSLRELVGNAGD